MKATDTGPSPRSITLDAADNALWDLNGIKTSIATSLSVQSYSGAGLNGVLANPGPAVLDPPRFASVTTTTSGATYTTASPIVVTGTYGGETVTDSLTLTQAGGNETIIGTQPFDTITSIDVPAQLGTGGAFTFGVDGVASKKRSGERQVYRQIRANAAGNVKLGYPGGYTDTLSLTAGETTPLLGFTRVFGNGGTAVKVTIFE